MFLLADLALLGTSHANSSSAHDGNNSAGQDGGNLSTSSLPLEVLEVDMASLSPFTKAVNKPTPAEVGKDLQ